MTGFVEAKLAALLRHESQLRSTMGIARRDAGNENQEVLDFRQRVMDRLAEHGREGGFAAAEAFKRIDKL